MNTETEPEMHRPAPPQAMLHAGSPSEATPCDLTPPEATPAEARPSGPTPNPQPDPRALLLELQKSSVTFRDYKPVALRIDKAILARFPALDRKVVRSAMRMHTASTRYLKAMEKATLRFDLDGQEAGEVTEEHRAFATQTLKERFAEAARRKRDKLKQDQAREREQEAEQRKAEKLQQLVGKFGRGGDRDV
jgi:ProP effector